MLIAIDGSVVGAVDQTLAVFAIDRYSWNAEELDRSASEPRPVVSISNGMYGSMFRFPDVPPVLKSGSTRGSGDPAYPP